VKELRAFNSSWIEVNITFKYPEVMILWFDIFLANFRSWKLDFRNLSPVQSAVDTNNWKVSECGVCIPGIIKLPFLGML
jgi:hypothetical protein